MPFRTIFYALALLLLLPSRLNALSLSLSLEKGEQHYFSAGLGAELRPSEHWEFFGQCDYIQGLDQQESVAGGFGASWSRLRDFSLGVSVPGRYGPEGYQSLGLSLFADWYPGIRTHIGVDVGVHSHHFTLNSNTTQIRSWIIGGQVEHFVLPRLALGVTGAKYIYGANEDSFALFVDRIAFQFPNLSGVVSGLLLNYILGSVEFVYWREHSIKLGVGIAQSLIDQTPLRLIELSLYWVVDDHLRLLTRFTANYDPISSAWADPLGGIQLQWQH